MHALLDRKLIVITGKGGVGKTTIAAAVGLLAARAGRRTIVAELGRESRLPALFDRTAPDDGVECELQERLSSITIDPDRALLEWLQVLGGRVSGRVLASSGTFQYFAAAAPGAKELVTMVKLSRLTHDSPRREREHGGRLVILDAPATGHALGLLASPYTFGAIARVGPIAGQARQLQELLASPAQSAYVAVALGSETAVTEALELEQCLRARLGCGLSTVVVNGLLPQRFTRTELARIESLRHGPVLVTAPSDGTHTQALAAIRSAQLAAKTVHERARFQHAQVARLRRRGFDVASVPFAWTGALGAAELARIAGVLERRL